MLEENDVEIDDTPNIAEHNMSTSDYLVAFSDQTQYYCVGMVDMVNSTKMAAILGTKNFKVLPNIPHFNVKIFEQVRWFCKGWISVSNCGKNFR